MKKKLFCFMVLGTFLLTGFSFADNDAGPSKLSYKDIDDWSIEITGTNGLSDVQFIFIKSVAKNKIKNEKANIISNIEVVINDEPYKLKFKKSYRLNNNDHLEYLSTIYDEKTGKQRYSTGVLEDDYVLEFELDNKSSDLILPESILLQSKRQLINESSLRYSLFSKDPRKGKIYPLISVETNLKIDSKIRSGGYEYGSKNPPYTCCYICLSDFSFGDMR